MRAHLVGLRAVSTCLLAFAATGLGAANAQDDADTERAVILFEESETAYNNGEFTQAAALLRRAYTLHPDATLLFNLARALEGAGDLDGAIANYERYLEEATDAPDRGAVEARLTTLRRQRTQLAHPEPDPAPEPQAEFETETESESGSSARLGGWILAAGGVAVAVAGVGFGVASQNRSDDAAAEPVQEDAVALHDEAKTRATLANVFLIAGGALIVGGVLWGILTLGSDGDTEVSVGPGGIGVRGRF